MRQRSRALRQGPGAAESKSCGPGQGRPEWRRSGLMVGGRAAGAELRSNSEAASQALIERESPVQPPARLQPAGKNGAWGGGGATEPRSSGPRVPARCAGASRDRDSASPVWRARRSLRARRMGDRRAGAPRERPGRRVWEPLARGPGPVGEGPAARAEGGSAPGMPAMRATITARTRPIALKGRVKAPDEIDFDFQGREAHLRPSAAAGRHERSRAACSASVVPADSAEARNTWPRRRAGAS